MTRRAWTDADMAKLRELYATTDNAEIGAVLGRTHTAVKRMAEINGMRKADEFAGRWTDEETAKFVQLYPVTTLRELKRIFNRSGHSISKKVKALKLKKVDGFKDTGLIPGAPSAKRLAFLAACEPLLSRPIGALQSELVEAAKTVKVCAKSFLFKAAKSGQLHMAGQFKHTRYFLTYAQTF